MKLHLLSTSVLFLLWGLLQFAAGYKSFLFVILPPPENPMVMVFWIVYFIWLWADSAWVVWGGGAEELHAIRPSGASGYWHTPQRIKLFHAAASLVMPMLVLLGFWSGVFNQIAAGIGDLIR
jgi:hypothetical protein